MTISLSAPILIIILCFFASFFAGNFFRGIFYRDRDICKNASVSGSCTLGFIIIIVISGMIHLFVQDFQKLFVISFIIVLLILAVGLISFLMAKDYKCYISPEASAIFKNPFWYLFFAVILVLSVINIYLHLNEPPITAFLPLIILPLSLMSHYRLSIRLFSSPKRQLVFLYLLIFVFLFSGFSGNTLGASLLLLPHNSFTAFAGILLPLIFAWFLDIYREKADKITYIKLCLTFLSGVLLCTEGSILLPALIISLIIPLIIAGIIKGYAPYSFKTLGCLAISYIPALIISLIKGFSIAATPLNIYDWLSYFLDIFSPPMVIPMILGLLFIIMTNKEKRMKLMFGGMVAILFLTILNPLLIQSTSLLFPGEFSYIKIYFLLPIYIFIAFSGTFYCFMFARLPLNITAAIIICVGIALFGRFVYIPENGVQNPQNNVKYTINFYEEHS